MERDFMGLVAKNASSVTVKQEIDDSVASTDPEPMTKSGVQWSFSSNGANCPQILSFNSPQGGVGHKLYSPGAVQRSSNLDKQVGYQQKKYDTQPLNHAHEKKIFPVSTQTTQAGTIAVGVPSLQSHLVATAAGQSILSSVAVGAASIAPLVPIGPSHNAVVGSTDLGCSVKPSNGPAQLTIFYNGLVCVFDDVSFEKAQAIMLLAGNGNSKNLATAPKVQPQLAKPTSADGCIISQNPSFSSAVSMLPPVGSSSGGMASAAVVVNHAQPPLAPQNIKSELPNVVGARGGSALKLVSSGVPMARKASLARFLDKRKERVASASPYTVPSKNSSECSTSSGVDPASFVLNSAPSSPLSAVN